MAQSLETPPPPAPQQQVWPFHAVSVGVDPRAVHDVPPTPVTKGWLDGSSTAKVSSLLTVLPRQSSDPSSPEAATMVWPWMAASSKRVFSARAVALPVSGSHRPHDVETTLAWSWSMIEA